MSSVRTSIPQSLGAVKSREKQMLHVCETCLRNSLMAASVCFLFVHLLEFLQLLFELFFVANAKQKNNVPLFAVVFLIL